MASTPEDRASPMDIVGRRRAGVRVTGMTVIAATWQIEEG
jgi:hypothetical protein